MSQVEELLNSLSETFPEHTHPVVDSDNYFVIDPVTRIIKNMTNGPLVIMQRDHKSTVYTFQLPRYIDGHDMSLCNRVKCHFNNVENNEENGGLIEHADVAELTDLRVNPDDRNTVICSWTITRQATQYAGALGFFIQYLCVDDEGNETYEWHTDEFVEVVVKKTKHNDEQAIVEYTAIFEQWRERIFGAGDSVKSEMIALTEEKLRAIENKGTEQAAKVTNEGLRVLDTIPEDYTAMSEQVRMLSRFAGPVIRQEREGKSIAVKDSAKMPLLGLQMFGKSKQKTTIGKNILDTSMSNSISLNGYENYNSNNDVISITNTALFGFKVPVEYGVNYSLSLDKLVVDAVFHFRVYEYSAEPITIDPNAEVNYLQTAFNESCAGKNRVEKRYTPTSDAVKWITVGFYTDKTNTLSNLQMEIGTEVTKFEPFSGGKASPNPEYPQEIVSIKNPTTMVCGKNLWNLKFDNVDLSSISGWGNAVWGADVIQLMLKPDTTYTLSFDVTCLSIPEYESLFDDAIGFNLYSGRPGGTYMVLCVDKNNGVLTVGETRHAEQTFTTPSNIDDTTIGYNILRYTQRFLKSDGTAVYATVKFENIQLEEGGNATEYKPFVGGSILAETELPGLPVSSGGNYTDENGQQYIANYRDWERSVDVKRINTIQLWSGFVINESTNETWIQLPDDIAAAYVTEAVQCLCTHFPGDSRQNVYDNAFKEGYRGICARDRFVRIVDNVNFKSNPEALNAWIDEKSAAGVPVTLTYILNKPIETPIPEAELQAYRELHTNYPNTTILNDSGAYMKLAYATDTKMYIDNKFAELQAALTKES